MYMIETEQRVGEDYNGRDIYDFVLDPDIGYFTTREDAQAYILKRCTPTEKVFNANEAQRKREWQRKKKAWEQRQKTIQVLSDAGLPVQNVPWAADPGEFTPKVFDPTPSGMGCYDIVEIEPHSG